MKGKTKVVIANKEFILNYATNRWGLNKKRSVGPTSDSIRQCSPRDLDEWKNYYYSNVRTVEEIDEVGRRLFEIVREILPRENRFFPDLLDSITENDCIEYIHTLVINKQYEGYNRERN